MVGYKLNSLLQGLLGGRHLWRLLQHRRASLPQTL